MNLLDFTRNIMKLERDALIVCECIMIPVLGDSLWIKALKLLLFSI